MAKGPQINWVGIKPWDIAICTPRKVGTSSVTRALTREFNMSKFSSSLATLQQIADPEIIQGIPEGEKPPQSRRVLVIRHPVERFKSLYANKVLKQGERLGTARTRRLLRGVSTPEELMAVIRSGETDRHWQPQIEFSGGHFNELVRLERLSRWWNELPYTSVPLPRENPTESHLVDISPALRREIEALYSEDLDLYEQA